MKKLKCILLTIAGLVLLFKVISWFIPSPVLVKERDLPNKYVLTEADKKMADKYVFPDSMYDMKDPCSLARNSLDITCAQLEFAYRNDIKNGKANCDGYAMKCASLFNYIRKANGLSDKYFAKPVVGQVYWFGINMNKLLMRILPAKYTGFVKNHSFVEFQGPSDYVYADPSLYDVFGNKCWQNYDIENE